MPDDTIQNAIEQNAVGPASTSVDGTSVQMKSIGEQIEADRYLAGKRAAAAARPALGLRMTKLIPPGGGL